MQASQRMRSGVQPLGLVMVLLMAMLLSGAAGYLIRGGSSQAQAPAVTQSAPARADANAAAGIPYEHPADEADRNAAPATGADVESEQTRATIERNNDRDDVPLP